MSGAPGGGHGRAVRKHWGGLRLLGSPASAAACLPVEPPLAKCLKIVSRRLKRARKNLQPPLARKDLPSLGKRLSPGGVATLPEPRVRGGSLPCARPLPDRQAARGSWPIRATARSMILLRRFSRDCFVDNYFLKRAAA